MSDQPLTQPGLFIANRPFLGLVLLLAALGLIGFADGTLLDPVIRGNVLAAVQGLLPISLAATVMFFAPLAAPDSLWGRGLIAAALAIASGVVVLFMPDTGIDVAAVVVASIVGGGLMLGAPLFGRYVILAAAIAPLVALINAFVAYGYLQRVGFEADALVLQLVLLGFVLTIMFGHLYSTRMARFFLQGEASRLGVGHAVNQLVRDVVFLAVAAGLVFRFYVQDPLTNSTGLSLFLLGVALTLLSAVSVMLVLAALHSVLPFREHIAQSRKQADARAHDFFHGLLKKVSTPIFVSVLLCFVGLAIITLMEIPLAATLVAVPEKGVFLSGIIRLAFYGLLFGLIAVVYSSLRTSAIVIMVLMLSDFLSAGVMSLTVSLGGEMPAVEIRRLADAGPRLLILLFLIRFAHGWRSELEYRDPQEVVGIFASRLPPALCATLLAIGGLALAAFVLPDMPWMSYMAAKTLCQLVIAMMLLPMAMAALSRLKISL